MKTEKHNQFVLYDYEPVLETFQHEVLDGLNQTPKQLPCKLFYDKRGSKLFEQICQLDEYYPTRTEIGILQNNIAEIVDALGENCLIIEFGTGSGIKTHLLLDHLEHPAAYIPIEIDKSQLIAASRMLKDEYPRLEVIPVCADFNQPIELPQPSTRVDKTVAFFPGSTIGNFIPDEAAGFLKNVVALCGGEGGLLLGVDLQKDKRTLEKAYDDSSGVTAAFNLNILARIKSEFGAKLSLSDFRHYAFYNEKHNRIEMHIVSLKNQSIALNGSEIFLEKGEHITTEYSYKYTVEEFAEMANQCGLELAQAWVDEQNLFSVQYFEVSPDHQEIICENEQLYSLKET